MPKTSTGVGAPVPVHPEANSGVASGTAPAGIASTGIASTGFASTGFASAILPNAQNSAAAQTNFRIDLHRLPGGSELLTVFASMPDPFPKSLLTNPFLPASFRVPWSIGTEPNEIPLIAVLRDTYPSATPSATGPGAGPTPAGVEKRALDNTTAGNRDSSTGRLRYVWVLTSARPTVMQRITGSIPFFYWRAGFGRSADSVPSPILDLGSTHRTVWTRLAGLGAQTFALDPEGPYVRTFTRSYQNNTRDYHQMRLAEGLSAVSQLEHIPDMDSHLGRPELLEIQARLALAGQTLGGLVGSSNLPAAYKKQRTRTLEDRGHNWELLRQRAEMNGLYFEPFGLMQTSTQALLWIAREDVGNSKHAFNGSLLGISNPYKDSRLKQWTGFTKTVMLEDGRTQELIPLALYGLDHPKVPLMLVDFRRTHAAKTREMVRHAAVDALFGVVGVSRFTNLPFFAGSWAFTFVRERHGGAENRYARLRSYAEVRQWLALDSTLDPEFRTDLLKRLDMMGVNPMETSVLNQASFARKQYAVLVRSLESPDGLAARLEKKHQKRENAAAPVNAGQPGGHERGAAPGSDAGTSSFTESVASPTGNHVGQ